MDETNLIGPGKIVPNPQDSLLKITMALTLAETADM